jgi:hypothetical protein
MYDTPASQRVADQPAASIRIRIGIFPPKLDLLVVMEK